MPCTLVAPPPPATPTHNASKSMKSQKGFLAPAAQDSESSEKCASLGAVVLADPASQLRLEEVNRWKANLHRKPLVQKKTLSNPSHIPMSKMGRKSDTRNAVLAREEGEDEGRRWMERRERWERREVVRTRNVDIELGAEGEREGKGGQQTSNQWPWTSWSPRCSCCWAPRAGIPAFSFHPLIGVLRYRHCAIGSDNFAFHAFSLKTSNQVLRPAPPCMPEKMAHQWGTLMGSAKPSQ